MTHPRNAFVLLAMTGILLLAAALRLHLISAPNLNWDEAYTHWLTAQPFAQMLETTAADVHPPLYYTLARLIWLDDPGAVWLVRLVSVWAGVVGVALAYRLGASVAGRREAAVVGVLAALLLAISRAHIEISQLARMHALALLFVTGALWATLALFDDMRRRRAMIAYVLCTAGALYTFYLAVVGPLVTNIAFLVVWWRRGRPLDMLWRWMTLQLAAVALFLPWALYALPRLGRWEAAAAGVDASLPGFYAITLLAGLPAYIPAYASLLLAAAAVVVAGIVAILWRGRSPDGAATRPGTLLLLLLAIPGPALLFALLSSPLFDLGSRPLAARYLLSTLAAFSVLAAWGIVAIGRTRPRGIGLLAAVSGAGVIGGAALFGLSTAYDAHVPHDDYASAGLHLSAHRFPGDAFVLHTDFDWRRVQIHHDGPRIDVPHAQPVNDGYANYLLENVWPESGAVWLLLTPDAQVNDPTGAITRWLESRAVKSREWQFNRNRLIVYARTPQRAATLDDLAPQTPLRATPANDFTGVVAVEMPYDRYAVGDTLHIAVTWSDPPQQPAITLHCGDVVRDVTLSTMPEPISGPVRWPVSALLTPELPPGQCRLLLDDFVELGAFTLVANRDSPLVDALPQDAQTANIGFGESIMLDGYTLSRDTLAAGDSLDVTLFWRTDAALDTRYKVSVFLLGTTFNPATGGPLWAQIDAEPGNWQFPTTRWPPDTFIRDRYTLKLPDDAPPGDYTLGVVVYGAVDGVRLVATGADGVTLAQNVAALRVFTVE